MVIHMHCIDNTQRKQNITHLLLHYTKCKTYSKFPPKMWHPHVLPNSSRGEQNHAKCKQNCSNFCMNVTVTVIEVILGSGIHTEHSWLMKLSNGWKGLIWFVYILHISKYIHHTTTLSYLNSLSYMKILIKHWHFVIEDWVSCHTKPSVFVFLQALYHALCSYLSRLLRGT